MTVPTAGRSGWALLLVDVGDEADHLLELVEVDVLLRGDFDEFCVAAWLEGWRPRVASCWMTFCGLASGLSILLTATMIGTLAARAWSIASRVWGMTPSSAATTMDDDVRDLGSAGTHAGEGLGGPGCPRKTISRPKAERSGLVILTL